MTIKEDIEQLLSIKKLGCLTDKDRQALNRAIKALERPQGEWVRKEDVIHSIAKQYSEHNELVPIWLSIADMKGGAE